METEHNSAAAAPDTRVFLIEQPRPETRLDDAKRFGQLVTVFDKDTRRTSVFNTEAYCEDLIERLEILGFDVDRDYVCVVGALVTVTVTVARIASRFGRISLLLFRANEEGYVERTICAIA